MHPLASSGFCILPRPKLVLSGCLAVGIAFLAFFSCSEQVEQRKAPASPGTVQNEVARVAMDGGGMKVRRAGESGFEPWDGKSPLARGCTIRSGQGFVSLNFMGSVQVELSTDSELILEGAVKAGPSRVYVLGLKSGEVRINSSADCPIVLRLPHGEVSGVRSFFSVDLERVEDNTYTAVVKAFSKNIMVKNDLGSMMLPSWGVVRADEKEPPKLLKDLNRRG